MTAEKKLVDLKKNDPWSYISEALSIWLGIHRPYDMFEAGSAFDSKLFRIARNIVRMAAERQKPNENRLKEYRDVSLESMRESILSKDPIYADLEILRLTDSLGSYLEDLDLEYPTEEKPGLNFLDGRSPKEMASFLVSGTKLASLDERKKLLDSSYRDLTESNDPMIRFALKVDPIARNYRTQYDQQVIEPLRQAYTMISKIQFKAYGMNSYPDATFTLRLSIGKIAGYNDDSGNFIPAWTDFAGAFQREAEHRNTPPFSLPDSWHRNKDNLRLNTPLNIVSTNDIIGGNSGSPLVNKKGEIVGLIFDGNIQSLVSNFIYTEKQARAVSVHSEGIIEGLKNIYHADRIVNEIGK